MCYCIWLSSFLLYTPNEPTVADIAIVEKIFHSGMYFTRKISFAKRKCHEISAKMLDTFHSHLLTTRIAMDPLNLMDNLLELSRSWQLDLIHIQKNFRSIWQHFLTIFWQFFLVSCKIFWFHSWNFACSTQGPNKGSDLDKTFISQYLLWRAKKTSATKRNNSHSKRKSKLYMDVCCSRMKNNIKLNEWYRNFWHRSSWIMVKCATHIYVPANTHKFTTIQYAVIFDDTLWI